MRIAGRRTYDQAAKILTEESGIRFDPAVVQAFLRVPMEDWEHIRAQVHEG